MHLFCLQATTEASCSTTLAAAQCSSLEPQDLLHQSCSNGQSTTGTDSPASLPVTANTIALPSPKQQQAVEESAAPDTPHHGAPLGEPQTHVSSISRCLFPALKLAPPDHNLDSAPGSPLIGSAHTGSSLRPKGRMGPPHPLPPRSPSNTTRKTTRFHHKTAIARTPSTDCSHTSATPNAAPMQQGACPESGYVYFKMRVLPSPFISQLGDPSLCC